MLNYTLDKEDKNYIKLFVQEYEPRVMKVILDENGASVLVADEKGNYSEQFWVDVCKEMDMYWNKYIFDLTNARDVIENEILYNSLDYLPDDSDWSFTMDVFDVVEMYLTDNGIVSLQDDGSWAWSENV